MSCTLNASTSNGLITTADTSGTIQLQANGTTVLSATPTGVAITGTLSATGTTFGGQLQTQLFTAPGTFTVPASTTQVRVKVVGGGGGGSAKSPSLAGGVGGFAYVTNIPVSAPVAITIGAGGTGGAAPAGSGTSGGTSSFGSAVSCTGGAGGTPSVVGANGSATISSGTTLGNNVAMYTTVTEFYGGGIALNTTNSTAAVVYSPTGTTVAGGGGASNPGPTTGIGGTGGAILVEFVG